MFNLCLALIAIHCTSVLYLRISDKGNGKKKNIAGWLLFGLMWPQIRQQIEKDPKNSEIIFMIMLTAFVIAAVVIAYLITNGTISFL